MGAGKYAEVNNMIEKENELLMDIRFGKYQTASMI